MGQRKLPATDTPSSPPEARQAVPRRESVPLERGLPVGLKVNAPPVVGGRLHNSQGDKPWNWKGKADRAWLDRRIGALHTGNPCLGCCKEDLTELQGMFGEEEGPYAEGGGSFGTLFKAQRKADGAPVVIKVLRISRTSYHKEIMNEICMHEVLAPDPLSVLNLTLNQGALSASTGRGLPRLFPAGARSFRPSPRCLRYGHVRLA